MGIINTLVSGGIAVIVIAAFVCLFFIIMNALLVHGARLKKAGYLIPWLIYTAIPMILVAAQLIFVGVLSSGSGTQPDNETTSPTPATDDHKLDQIKESGKMALSLLLKALFAVDAVSSIIFIIINGFLSAASSPSDSRFSRAVNVCTAKSHILFNNILKKFN